MDGPGVGEDSHGARGEQFGSSRVEHQRRNILKKIRRGFYLCFSPFAVQRFREQSVKLENAWDIVKPFIYAASLNEMAPR
ncbi:MAG TPA: hypothetical protein VJP86_00635 [Vicinamibacterales bacterium]|nr:hypothetical protein [Vicinamibacterales bacterium]